MFPLFLCLTLLLSWFLYHSNVTIDPGTKAKFSPGFLTPLVLLPHSIDLQTPSISGILFISIFRSSLILLLQNNKIIF